MAPAASEPSWRSWALLLGLGLSVLVRPTACARPKDDGGAMTSEVVDALLAQVGPGVVQPALADFAAAVEGLQASLEAWDGADSASRAEAQAAWMAAMRAWQRVEVMQIGSLGSSLTAAGGADLADEIYSWPTVNPCRVDQETAEAAWDEPDFFSANLVNSYGLDAIEHLLWAGADNACPSQTTPNSDGAWEALGAEGVAANRAAFSRALAAEVLRRTREVQADWEGGFAQALAEGSSPYEDRQQALNAVYDALFYLEIETKDRKLAWPMGLGECGSGCAEDVEGLESGSGAASIAGNLEGFRALFLGGEGTGWDELLADLGHEDLAAQIQADTEAALALALALDRPLDEAIEEGDPRVEELYAAVKTVTDALKGDVATLVGLEIPGEAAGDND